MKTRILACLLALAVLLAAVPALAATVTETATVTGTATEKGFGGDVTVNVTLADGVITAVEIVGDSETNGIGSKIVEEWPEAFVNANGIVDTYTGATFAYVTRAAVIAAMRAALANAGVNPDDYMREAAAAEKAEDLVLDTDIVIVGAGGAGMTAAIVAADPGKKGIVLEGPPRSWRRTQARR